MNEEKFCKVKDGLIVSLLLTFVGGFLNSYTYILYDKVFANTQTGNLIFLSISLTNRNIKEVILRIIPIIVFFISIFIVEFIKEKWKCDRKTTMISTVINMVLFLIIGLGIFKDNNIIITAIISFVCANMMVIFKKVKGDIYAPTMCTGNMRSCAISFAGFILHKDKSQIKIFAKYIGIMIMFCIGVSSGIICVHLINYLAIYICIAIFFVICIMFIKALL